MLVRRYSDEPAFVLHRYDWSETSLILDVFTRRHGRLALVAKGVKRPSSQFRAVLLPLQPLFIGWTGQAEVRTLKTAQWQGGHVMPTGDALLWGSYLNELILRMLARDDAHTGLFDHYQIAVRLLAQRQHAAQPILRAFELLLLHEVGLLPHLAQLSHTLAGLDPQGLYALTPEHGLCTSEPQDPHALSGQQCIDLQTALRDPAPFMPTLHACSANLPALRAQLRRLLLHHSGVKVFKTRQLMLDVQAMNAAYAQTPGAIPSPAAPLSAQP